MSARRVAILVVPGIGDDAPGRTRDGLVRLLRGVGRYEATSPTHETLLTMGWRGRHRMDRVELGGSADGHPDLDVHEMYWADLSRSRGGGGATLLSVWGLALQLPALGIRMIEGPEPRDAATWRASRPTRLLLEALQWAMVAGLFLAALAGLVMGLLIAALLWQAPAAGEWLTVAVLAVVLLALAALGVRLVQAYGWASGRHRVPLVWAIGLGSAAAGAAAAIGGLDAESGPSAQLAWALAVLVAWPLRIGWLAVAVLVGVTAIALLVRRARARGADERRATTSALLGVTFGPMLLLLAVQLVYGVLGVPALSLLAARGDRIPADRLHCLDGPGDWSGVPGSCGAGTGVAEWAQELMATAAAPGLIAIAVGLLALVAVGFAQRIALFAGRDALVAGAAAAAAVASSLFALAAAAGRPEFLGSDRYVEVWTLCVVVIGAGSGALFLLSGPLGAEARVRGLDLVPQGVDLAQDIVNYWRVPFSRPAPHESASPSAWAGVKDPPRSRMLDRLSASLAAIAARRPAYDGVIIVSHSQGTVLSVSALTGLPRVARRARVAVDPEVPGALPGDVALVTMGSPLLSLYEERFPGHGWVPEVAAMRPAVRCWVNLFTADDGVGREVFPGTGVPGPAAWPPAGARFQQQILDARGHGGYWKSRQVAEWILALAGRPEPRR